MSPGACGLSGYTVYTPPNQLQGLSFDAAYLADFLHSVALLVGRSEPLSQPGILRSKRSFTWTPSAQAQGQTLEQLLASYPGTCAVPANLNVVPFPVPPRRW